MIVESNQFGVVDKVKVKFASLEIEGEGDGESVFDIKTLKINGKSIANVKRLNLDIDAGEGTVKCTLDITLIDNKLVEVEE